MKQHLKKLFWQNNLNSSHVAPLSGALNCISQFAQSLLS